MTFGSYEAVRHIPGPIGNVPKGAEVLVDKSTGGPGNPSYVPGLDKAPPSAPAAPSVDTGSGGSGGSKGNSLIFMIGVFVFVISLLVAGGAFAWGKFLEARQVQLGEDLKVLAKDYNVELISLFKQTDTKISIAKDLLDRHVAMSQVFGLVSRFTAENIRFINLDNLV
jgi:hypothetical protein